MPIKSSIAFGLVYIPVTLHPTVKSTDAGFNLLDRKTGGKIRYKKVSPSRGTDEEIKNEDIIKGYRLPSGEYVTFEEKELRKIWAEKDKTLTVTEFVSPDEINPLYYEKTYYAVPDGAEKAYALLTEALSAENKVGVAKTVFGYKQTVVAVRAENGMLMVGTLHFADEIAASPTVKKHEVGPAELELARSLISSMTGKFDANGYEDEYRARLLAAVDAKVAGKEISAAPTKGAGKVIDLMEALKASLAARTETETPKRKPTAASKAKKRA